MDGVLVRVQRPAWQLETKNNNLLACMFMKWALLKHCACYCVRCIDQDFFVQPLASISKVHLAIKQTTQQATLFYSAPRDGRCRRQFQHNVAAHKQSQSGNLLIHFLMIISVFSYIYKYCYVTISPVFNSIVSWHWTQYFHIFFLENALLRFARHNACYI